MKTFIVALLFIPILLFAGVMGNLIRRFRQAPRAFSLKDFPMPPVGEAPKSDHPQILSGWNVYTSKGCVFCHGPGGAGGVKNRTAVGGLIPSLINVADGYSLEELKRKIQGGVKSEDIATDAGVKSPPPLYMPAWKENLTEKELDDLAAYLMSLAPKKKEESWE